nr:putative wall-associated receptor kinase-like 16 [Aegilops tauschii subsp. strangulata]
MLLISVPSVVAGDPPMTMPNCNATCGNVSVPYPFGMGPARCYWPGFKLTCDYGSKPPRLLLGESSAGAFEVVDISLENTTMRVTSHGVHSVNMSDSGDGLRRWSWNLNGEAIGGVLPMPYILRWDGNELILTGCNVEEGWLNEDRINHLRFAVGRRATKLKVPVILDWMVPHGAAPTDYNTWACPADAARTICKSTNSQCTDKTAEGLSPELRGYVCQCNKGYEGNPYLSGGCQDIRECDRKEKHGCFGDCEELPGTFRCQCPIGTDGNPNISNGCIKPTVNTGHHHMGLIIGLSVASGPCVLLLVLGALLIARELKQHKAKTLRRKFFIQNRGQLLKQLVSHRADIAERMIISLEEVKKATNNFDQARRLGGGGHGTVYKGILSDLHVVAIKKSRIHHKNIEREIEEFINEVAILSQINHRNIVKLHGCCLESEVPLLAYEFISNGTLSDHLHTEAPGSLSWKDRLRITSEISKALAYLHSAISVPIIHRDIKPSNILLDDALTAKVSDFGASRYILDQIGTTTVVQGTIGYLDPIYFYTRRLTESSDVYSFGVLLVELLTRKRPSLCRSSEGDWLVMQFVQLLEDGNLADILDPQILDEGGSEVEEVATLAASCIKLIAEERPTMRQVEMALEALQEPEERVLSHLIEENLQKQHTTPNYPTTSKISKQGEATRCRSLEEEFMLSARHPR